VTDTKVTLSDGRVFVESSNQAGEKVLTEQKTCAIGFVVDETPDLQVKPIAPL